MKMTGAEWKAFYEEGGWPEGYIWSDESLLDDGRDIGKTPPEPTEIFNVPSWWHCHREDEDDEGIQIIALIRRWRKKRDNVMLCVEIPKAQEDEARAYFSEKKWKVA